MYWINQMKDLMQLKPIKIILTAIVSVIIILSTIILVADSEEEENYPQERVKVGDSIPILSFTDVFDKQDSNNYGDEWFFLYCFANYKNFDLLLSWVSSAAVEAYRYCPGVKWRAIAIPDLMSFPNFISIIGKPFFRIMIRAALKDVKLAYEEAGFEFPSPNSKFYVVPDWSGKYHYTFGLENADKYQVVMVSKGKVFAVFDQDTLDIKTEFLKKFREWADTSRCKK